MIYFYKLCLRYFLSPSFYAAIALFFLLCLFGATVNVNSESYSVFELLLNNSLIEEAQTDFSSNSYYLLRNFSGSVWFIVALPVICGFPALDIYSNYCKPSCAMILSRTSRKSYSAAVIMSSFFSGAVIAILGILLYGITVYSVFPDIASFNVDFLQSVNLDSQIGRFTEFFPKASNCIIVSGLLSVIAVIILCLIRDKFMSLSLPMMLMYVSTKLIMLYSWWIAQEPSRYDDKTLETVYMLFLSSAVDIHYYMPSCLGIPYSLYFPFTALILLVFIHLFKGIGTRI